MSINLIGKSAAWPQATYAWRAKLLLIGIVLISLFVLLPTQVQAQTVCPTGACVTTGSRLTNVDSKQGILRDALLGDLLGADLNLTALDANGLAQGSVGLEELLDDLQLDLGAATPEQVLTTDITLAQLLAAAADVGSDAAIVTALDNLAANVNLPTGTIQLGDLLQIATPDGSLSNSDLNALDLVVGAVQLFNSANIVSTPAPMYSQCQQCCLHYWASCHVLAAHRLSTSPSDTVAHQTCA